MVVVFAGDSVQGARVLAKVQALFPVVNYYPLPASLLNLKMVANPRDPSVDKLLLMIRAGSSLVPDPEGLDKWARVRYSVFVCTRYTKCHCLRRS